MENAKKIFDLSSVTLMGGPCSEIIYHYTRMDNLNRILDTKSLWLNHIKHTNQPRDNYEFDAGNYFFWGKLYSVPENACHLKRIITYREEIAKAIRDKANICIFCTCPSSETPSQWELYGDGGKGVAIGFDSKQMIKLCEEHKFIIDQCFYTDENKERFWLKFSEASLPFLSAFNEKDGLNLLLTAVIIFSAYYKEYCFQWEQEVRILTDPFVKVQENDSQRRYVFDLNGKMSQLIKEIIVGPQANNDLRELKDLLNKHGLPKCEVRKSQIDS